MENLDLVEQRLERLENLIGKFENIEQTKVIWKIHNSKYLEVIKTKLYVWRALKLLTTYLTNLKMC